MDGSWLKFAKYPCKVQKQVFVNIISVQQAMEREISSISHADILGRHIIQPECNTQDHMMKLD